MGWFAILSLIISAAPLLIALIKMVEELIAGAGEGAIKKDTVLAGMEQFWKSAMSAGIAEKIFSIPWDSVKGIVGILIDVVVTILNVTGIFKKSTPVPA